MFYVLRMFAGVPASLSAFAVAFAGVPASLSAFAVAFAGVPQVSRHLPWRLREFPQVSRHLPWRLRESRKSLGVCRGVCGHRRIWPGTCIRPVGGALYPCRPGFRPGLWSTGPTARPGTGERPVGAPDHSQGRNPWAAKPWAAKPLVCGRSGRNPGRAGYGGAPPRGI